MFKLLLLLATGALVLGAQTPLAASAQSPVAGPSLGFIYDMQGQAIRPVLGIPGASLFGDPLEMAAPLAIAAISLDQSTAIVNDGAWKAVDLTDLEADPTVLPDGLPASGVVAVSESGSAAAIYDSGNSALSVVTGIGATLAATSVSLDALPGGITAMAVADDGSLLLTASVPDGGEALFWIGQDGSVRQLASLQATAAIRVWNEGANALVTDGAANQVWSIQNPGNNAAITLLASSTDGVSAPTGAALSTDGSQLWIANQGNGAVLGLNLSTRNTVSLNCGFNLTTVLPMSDGVSFRLTELNDGPLWLLDTTPGADPRVVFVPAIPAAASDEAAAQ